MPERYLAVPVETVTVGSGRVLAHSRAVARTAELDSGMAWVLRGCHAARTLEQHARHLAASSDGSGAAIAGLRSALSALVSAGLLIPETALCRQLQACGRPAKAPRLVQTGILTRGDLERLLPCATSLVTHARLSHRPLELVVADDGPSARTQSLTRAALSALAARLCVPVHYIGRREKQRLVHRLAREGIPADVAESAIFDVDGTGLSAGANRNSLLLAGAGGTLLEVDDDTRCVVYGPPHRRTGVDIIRGDPSESWFFATRREARAGAAPSTIDLFAAHEVLLGKTVGQCLEDLALGEVDAGERLWRWPGAVIRTTWAGYLGDAGTGQVLPLLVARGGERDRLLESESEFTSRIRSRQRLTVASGFAISEGGGWRGPHGSALDLRWPVPPFPPSIRGQRTVAGFVTYRCSESLFGYVPLAFRHAPPERRALTDRQLRAEAAGSVSAEILLAVIGVVPTSSPALSEEDRLRHLGNWLHRIGAAPAREFDDILRPALWRNKSHAIDELERSLRAHHEEPAFWARHVRSYLDVLRAHLPKSDYLVPRDLRAGRSIEEARALTRKIVRGYGRLLASWPDLWRATRRVTQRDGPVSSRIDSGGE